MTGVRAPLRWAGSKRGLLPEIRSLIPTDAARYVEPFFGSGCVYFDRTPGESLIGDLNADLMEFYYWLRRDPSALHERASAIPHTKDSYYETRATDPVSLDGIGRAARFLYLNRYCFNGVYRTNRKGQFNVPMGSQTGGLPSKIEMYAASVSLSSARMYTGDYRLILSEVRHQDFVYLDPPYMSKRKRYGEYGYGTFSTDKDLSEFALEVQRIDALGARILVSFGSIEGLEDVFQNGWTVREVAVARRVAAAAGARLPNQGEVLAWNF